MTQYSIRWRNRRKLNQTSGSAWDVETFGLYNARQSATLAQAVVEFLGGPDVEASLPRYADAYDYEIGEKEEGEAVYRVVWRGCRRDGQPFEGEWFDGEKIPFYVVAGQAAPFVTRHRRAAGARYRAAR